MEYQKPDQKIVVGTVLEILKERGSVDTQTKMHNLVLKKLINKNEDFTSSTRNPFNSGSKYSGYLYKVTKKCSSQ